MQIFTHFVISKPKYELEKTSKFKFHEDTIDTRNTIANRHHRVFSHFSQLLSSVVLTLLTLSHNTCQFSSNKLLIQAICGETVLEVLNTRISIVKTIHWYRS